MGSFYKCLIVCLVAFLALIADVGSGWAGKPEHHGGDEKHWHHRAITPLPRVVDALEREATMSGLAAHTVLLDITRAGNRLVAVGERGIVVLSDDEANSWRQAKVPTSVSLTAVEFPTPKRGWAVGHAGVVLKSEDAGETWTRQLDGRTAATLALEVAKARAAQSEDDAAAKRFVADAEHLVKDGPDKPFLDLYFENESTGFVVGAYGLMFRTEDAGRNWHPWMDRLDNPEGFHIYAIRGEGERIYLAGEQGLFLRSLDGGKSFERIETPYTGSFFTLALAKAGEIVLAGMRGNIYWSSDLGETFKKTDLPLPISLNAVAKLSDGSMVFANQAGHILASRDNGRTIEMLQTPHLPPVSGLAETGKGTIVTVGFAGAVRIPLSAAGNTSKTGGTQ